MDTELHRAVAHEAVQRGARANVDELWATLGELEGIHPKLIVDIGSGPGVLWAWWSLGAQVVGVSWAPENVLPAFGSGRLPDQVTDLVADPRERDTAQRVVDQVAGRLVDVLVLGGTYTEEATRHVFHAYAPMVRAGGRVLVHGIANPMTPGVRKFWRSLESGAGRSVVAQNTPIGYGILTIHGRDRAPHA